MNMLFDYKTYVETIVEKRGEIAPEEQFFLLSTIFCYLMLDFYVETRIRFSLRDKRLFEIIEVEIRRVDCISLNRRSLLEGFRCPERQNRIA